MGAEPTDAPRAVGIDQRATGRLASRDADAKSALWAPRRGCTPWIHVISGGNRQLR